MNKSKFCCFDFEAGSLNSNFAEPCELAAVIIEPRNLEIVDSFHSFMKPEQWESPYVTNDTMEFHAKNDGLTVTQVIEKWKTYPLQKEVWGKFTEFLRRHNERPNKPSPWSAPVPVGQNILNYDIPIVNRLCKLYGNVDKDGEPNIFNKRYVLDLRHILLMYFENSTELDSFSFDCLREYFGIEKTGAHTALVDTKQTANLFIRFLKLTRWTSEKTKFRGAVANA
jgi:DNA polymerase III epsilon subunit-like protein